MARIQTVPFLNDLFAITAHAKIEHSAGSHTLCAGQAGKLIRVHQIMIKPAEDATIEFLSNTTSLTGAMPVFAVATTLLSSVSSDGPLLAPYSPVGWFVCAAGEDLKMTTTGGDVAGSIAYSVLAA